jgi:hypothetical protein
MPDDVELADVVPSRPIVVTALALPPQARRALAERLAVTLGPVDVIDLRQAHGHADVVIAPSCSPQTIAALKAAFPSARLVVAELVDGEHGADFTGPVTRLRRAGADAYLTADGVDDLADQLTGRKPPPPVPLAARPLVALPAATVDEVVLDDLAAGLAAREATAIRPRREGPPT